MHKFYAFILSFLLVGMSTLGSYAQATTGNAAVDTVIRVQKSLFATVATGLAASAAIGLKAKQLYDDNKEAVYDHALDAYDSMSDNAKESWAAAVSRGRTSADLVDEVWDSFLDVMSTSVTNYSSYAESISGLTNDITAVHGSYFTRYDFSYPDFVYFYKNGETDPIRYYKRSPDLILYIKNDKLYSSLGTYNLVSSLSSDTVNSLNAGWMSLSAGSLASAMISAISTYTSETATFNFRFGTESGGVISFADYNPGLTWDNMQRRLLEQDIPRMKDAGMVLPEVDVRTPSGTRVNYDAQAGTVTLPDGSIYDGDLVAGNIPDAVIKDGDTVWHDTKTNTDTNIWDGSVTDSITGDTVPDVGENAGTAEGEAGAVGAGDLPAETDIENVPARGIVWTPLVQSAQDLTDRFPFSIPWDLSRMLGIFNTDPETPKFDIDIKKYVEIDGKTMRMKWTLDFSFLDPLASVGRWFLIIVFDIAMILGIRKIMPE